MTMKQRQLSKEDAITLYNTVFNICNSDGFVLEIDGIPYTKDELTYDLVVNNTSNITAIESKTIPNSRIYASNFVQIIVALSLNRVDTETIRFVRTSDNIVVSIYNTMVWCLDSGYNAAISDVKGTLRGMREFHTAIDSMTP